MALNNPYINAIQHETNVLYKPPLVETTETKAKEDRATSTSTSGLPLIKHQVDHKDTVISKKTSNSIRATSDVRENDNKIVLSDPPFPPHPISNETSIPLLNQDNHDLLARPSSLPTQTNDLKSSQPNSDRNQSSFMNQPFHIFRSCHHRVLHHLYPFQHQRLWLQHLNIE